MALNLNVFHIRLGDAVQGKFIDRCNPLDDPQSNRHRPEPAVDLIVLEGVNDDPNSGPEELCDLGDVDGHELISAEMRDRLVEWSLDREAAVTTCGKVDNTLVKPAGETGGQASWCAPRLVRLLWMSVRRL